MSIFITFYNILKDLEENHPLEFGLLVGGLSVAGVCFLGLWMLACVVCCRCCWTKCLRNKCMRGDNILIKPDKSEQNKMKGRGNLSMQGQPGFL